MTALPKRKFKTNNIIRIADYEEKWIKKENIRYNKDGSVSKRHTNKITGISSEVYPFTNETEIKSMINVFNKRIEEAPDNNKRQIACRNKMMFLIGINLGIRASDLVGLTYSFFMNNDGTFKDYYSLQPKKTKKTGKYVKLYFNQAVKKAITDYIEEYPIENIEEYLFKSRIKTKNGYITEHALWDIINKAAIEAGIEKNIGSHSLRKTFGYHIWHNAEDKEKALVMLMAIFNHSSVAITKKYIGILDEEMSDVFNSLDLGLDYM